MSVRKRIRKTIRIDWDLRRDAERWWANTIGARAIWQEIIDEGKKTA